MMMKKTLIFALIAAMATGCTKDELEGDLLVRAPSDTSEPVSFDLGSDSLALVALYDATNGDRWRANNWKSAPLRKWDGVETAKVDGVRRVVGLTLVGMKLTGSLPVQIGDLNALEILNLNENRELGGEIPSQIYNLTELVNLNLRFTAITGTLAPGIGKLQKLDTLNLSKPFHFHNNVQLTGSLPKELGSLAAIRYVNLDNNAFTGAIPAEIGGMKSLEVLQIWQNRLSGTIPSQIGSLGALKVLFAGNNMLDGVIPEAIGKLKSLKQLYLNDNNLEGEIPAAIGEMAALNDLDLSHNNLTGDIPSTVVKMKQIAIMHLNDNKLSGQLPQGICNENPILTSLWLQNNDLTGDIPVLTGFQIGDVVQKWYCSVVVYGNRMSGQIPQWIAQFPADGRKNLIPQQIGYGFSNQNVIQ